MHLLKPPAPIDSSGLTYWMKANDRRYPWARPSVREQIRGWIVEAENADKLVAAGEKVYPLLLSGPTRCGKTSTMCSLAAEYFELPSYRVNIGSVIAPLMGETTRNFQNLLMEAINGPQALWIMDEVDGLFPRRAQERGGGATAEMNAAMSVALAMIEDLPQHVMLVATTNEPGIIDPAMVARFKHVAFPLWEELDEAERRSFSKSHQLEEAWSSASYADVVHCARDARVKKILDEAKNSKGK
jgi:SpoVK/Ycf46/Vps4 family AAA+-type ATPase